MSRILFWLALVFLVIAAIRAKVRDARRAADAAHRPPAPPARRAAAEPEAMLCCAHCGVHFPASENMPANGRDYCCAAHADRPVR
jgi:uncharacterized protein